MKDALLDVLFNSEKRMNIILLLRDGPQEMDFILSCLSTSRQALLPQMKILKNQKLLYQLDDVYGLTSIGKLIADKMKPLLDLINTVDENSHYLKTHKIDGIPEPFLRRLHEIKDFIVFEPSHINSHELNMNHFEEAIKSKAVYFIATYMHLGGLSVLEQLVQKGTYASLIFTEEYFQKIIKENYDLCKYYLTCDNVKIYTSKNEITISSLTVVDTGFQLRLLYKDGEFSNKQMLCYNPKARKWGKDLYGYYLKDAELITKI
ncbi:winged helix-turn-helix domain-containing protein [uncultured Methanomethylovorans sp.]|uniref:helix-turn-helix transcriptional regulator n=1 Tax=uncultured Methanomethylovorans sp. TaxID=183759 RepID=UPI002AA66965|nr:winged helix-turn-helix domain-containing protein [uncultured Methanomethylovorans sp.]